MTSDPLGVGIVGVGNIYERYVRGLRALPGLEVVRCASRTVEKARRRATEMGITAGGSVDDLLADDAVDVVVDLGPPAAHEPINLAALAAGKHVYSEKPLGIDLATATRIGEAAEASGRLLGCAPEVFLGSAGQTARAAIDDGIIGDVIGGSAFVVHSRLEEWHPDPRAFFAKGAGPALDMGPYFVTALVNLLGPATHVSGMSRIGTPTRTVTSPDRVLDEVPVSVPTHIVGAIGFESGALVSVMLSFDVWPRRDRSRTLPFAEIYGSKGMLSLVDPDTTDGDVRVRLHEDDEWRVLPPVLPGVGPAGMVTGGFRGLGVADLAGALSGRPHRTHWSLAYHVQEILSALERTGPDGEVVTIGSRCERPSLVTEPWLPQGAGSSSTPA